MHKIDGLKPIRSWNQVGGSAPIHCVGTGKAILASNYDQLRDTIKHSLVKYTDKTHTSIKALDADIESTRRRGYAVDTGEFRERILSFGAVIRLMNEQPIAALGISLPDVNLPEDGETKLGELVRKAADNVSEKLLRQ